MCSYSGVDIKYLAIFGCCIKTGFLTVLGNTTILSFSPLVNYDIYYRSAIMSMPRHNFNA